MLNSAALSVSKTRMRNMENKIVTYLNGTRHQDDFIKGQRIGDVINYNECRKFCCFMVIKKQASLFLLFISKTMIILEVCFTSPLS